MGSGIRGEALMRFGMLLSQVFERSMDLHQLSDQHKILDYTLTWAPFSTHVKIFCKCVDTTTVKPVLNGTSI
jgi:hypothetical protein